MSEPRFKVGDRVRVTKPALQLPPEVLPWIPDMDRFDGTEQSILDVTWSGHCQFRDDHEGYAFHESWLTPVATPSPAEPSASALCPCSPCEAARFASWAARLRTHDPAACSAVRFELVDRIAVANPDGGLVCEIAYVLSCLGTEDAEGDDEAADHLDEMVHTECESQRLNPGERVCPRKKAGT